MTVRSGSGADPHLLQASRDGRHQEWNANTTDKHTDGDEALPAVGQPFGRQKLRIKKGVSWIPQRFSPPKPNTGLCSAHGLHREDDGRKPSDDRRAPDGNESEKRNSGKDSCHRLDYVCSEWEADTSTHANISGFWISSLDNLVDVRGKDLCAADIYSGFQPSRFNQ